MKQIVINEYEKVTSDDINQLQLAAAQTMQDGNLYRLFGEPAVGCYGSDLSLSYVSGTSGSIALGVGYFYDSSQTGNTPKFRQIRASSAVAVTFATPDPTNPRIDLVCLAPNFAVTGQASRYVKAGGSGPIALQNVNKIQEMTYTLQVVTGTPSGSPSVPATPSGYMAVAKP